MFIYQLVSFMGSFFMAHLDSTLFLTLNQEDTLLLNSLSHPLIQHLTCPVPVGISDFGVKNLSRT
jgi:hypothetical protein